MVMMKNNFKRTHPLYRGQRGAGLIEILISLTILAVGLLGVLSLQAKGLSSNQRAIFATDATLVANEMAEYILSVGNGSGANAGQFNSTNTDTGTYTSQDCSASCSIAQQVEDAQFEWDRIISNSDTSSLPNAYGEVSWSAPVYTITVRWDQDRTGATGTDCTSGDTETDLTCFSLQVVL